MDSPPGLRNTGSGGRAVAGLRMPWNAIIDPPVPGGSAQAAHRHCTRPFPGESGLATRDYSEVLCTLTSSQAFVTMECCLYALLTSIA